ncbi:MAG: polysaccharide biosynthesis C-terminal domain-containing protein [Clostridia bacterium]|nr:polysaccharide biosynthesis C-terminal domain-containing protein [Clostridia bacterium]
MKSRGQKAMINTAVLGLNQLITFACGLILPRYLLVSFGSDYNGVVSSITQFLGFISILHIGIAGSTRFNLYKVLADNDIKGISGIVNATERYMRKVGIVLIAYIAVLAFVYPYIASTQIPASEVGLLVLIVGASSVSQYFFGITYHMLLVADQRQYVYNILSSIATVLNVIIAVLLIISGQNIFVVKAGSAVIFVMVPILLSVYVRKKYNIDKKVPPDKTGLKGRWDVMWHSIANIVHDKTDLVVLTLFNDIKLVSVYTVYYLVVNGLYKILSIFTNSLEAAFGNMFAKKEVKTAYKNLELYEFFMCAFVSVVFSVALVLIVPFVKIYTKDITDINYIEPLFAGVAVIAQMVMCIRQPYLTVVQASGHYKQTRNGAFVEAGLNIVISVVLTHRFGLVGVAIGTLVANLFRTLQYAFYLSKNILHRPVSKPLLMMLWTALNVFVVYVIGKQFIGLIGVSSWLDWALLGIICVIIALLTTGLTAVIFHKKKLFSTVKLFKNLLIKKKSHRR